PRRYPRAELREDVGDLGLHARHPPEVSGPDPNSPRTHVEVIPKVELPHDSAGVIRVFVEDPDVALAVSRVHCLDEQRDGYDLVTRLFAGIMQASDERVHRPHLMLPIRALTLSGISLVSLASTLR